MPKTPISKRLPDMTIAITKLIVAVAAAALTFMISRRALRDVSGLEHPTTIALIVAILGGMGILQLGDGVVTFILLPYAALALTLATLFFINLIQGSPRAQGLREQAVRFARRLADRLKEFNNRHGAGKE